MIFIIGGRGRLGRMISESYGRENVIALKRYVYQDWWQKNSQNNVAHYFEPWTGSNSMIVIAAGLLDPRFSQEEHMKINYLLPKHVIQGAAKTGLGVVTFGTVMEGWKAKNTPYLYSKRALGNYVSDISKTGMQVLHLRLHTLYGSGQPTPFMFLGQIYRSIADQSVFEMTPGNQLREYHHVADDVRAIRILIDAGINGVDHISHGDPESLKNIANYVFKAFECEELLHVGALPEPSDENYDEVFQRPPPLRKVMFRKTLPAIVKYLKACIMARERGRYDQKN